MLMEMDSDKECLGLFNLTETQLQLQETLDRVPPYWSLVQEVFPGRERVLQTGRWGSAGQSIAFCSPSCPIDDPGPQKWKYSFDPEKIKPSCPENTHFRVSRLW